MSSGTLKLLAVAMVVLALIAGVAAWRLSTQYSEQARVAATQQAAVREAQKTRTLLVVATKPITAFEPIPADAVALASVEIAPNAFFTAVEDVAERTPLVDIDVGAPVTPRYFGAINQLARIIPQGSKAMSFEIDDVVAVGGFVRPGDTVDVLMYVRGLGSNATSQARTLLEEALVLGYEERIIDRPEGAGGDGGNQRRRIRTAVIAVPDDEVTRVLLGDSVGTLRLALHGAQVLDGDELPGESGELPLISDSDAEKAEDDKPDVITLAELTALKKAQGDKPKPPPRPAVYVYRGNDIETVRP
ncbi:Flp pilus assembly protein CpaB [bacterium]|nr:Flp pilus assembly protein CpaB [bacterium]